MDDVIRQANDSEYGLAAGIHTQDFNLSQKLIKELESGTVWVLYPINDEG